MPLTCKIYFLVMLGYEFEILSLVTIISIHFHSYQISACSTYNKEINKITFINKENKHRIPSFYFLVPTGIYKITFCIIIFSICNFTSISKIHGEHTTLLLLRIDSLRTCDIHTYTLRNLCTINGLCK